MSRTKRLHDGAPTDGPRKADYYATPEWAVRALIAHMQPPGPRHDIRQPLRIFDPGCGDGAILREFHRENIARAFDEAEALKLMGGMDIRQASVDECKAQGFGVTLGDFLTDSQPLGAGVTVVCNPPYGGRDNLAQRFVSRELKVQRPGGWVWMLLRMMWINDGQATFKRVTWLRETVGMPRVLSLPRRPSFTGKGSDATTYAWFGCQAGVVEKVGTFEILPEGADHV